VFGALCAFYGMRPAAANRGEGNERGRRKRGEKRCDALDCHANVIKQLLCKRAPVERMDAKWSGSLRAPISARFAVVHTR